MEVLEVIPEVAEVTLEILKVMEVVLELEVVLEAHLRATDIRTRSLGIFSSRIRI